MDVVTIGVITSISPSDPDASRLAAVLRHELGRRLGPTVLDLRTTASQGRQASPDWRTVRPGWSRGVSAVLSAPGVDLEAHAPRRVDCGLLTETLPLAALFDEQVDDLALDVRRRIREQRRQLLGEAADVDLGDPIGRQLDAGVETGIGDDVRAALHRELDRVADALTSSSGGVSIAPSAASIDVLRRAFADERRRADRLAEQVRQQLRENEILRERLVAAELDGS